jgi:hypothetical protein
MPTGGDLYEAYLRPLGETPELRAVIETKATVKAISRQGMGKVVTKGRQDRPFSLIIQNGAARVDHARAIIDASGTWQNQNPMGASGFPAMGEPAAAGWIVLRADAIPHLHCHRRCVVIFEPDELQAIRQGPLLEFQRRDVFRRAQASQRYDKEGEEAGEFHAPRKLRGNRGRRKPSDRLRSVPVCHLLNRQSATFAGRDSPDRLPHKRYKSLLSRVL